MTSWVPFMQQPELAALARLNTARPQAPPPPSSSPSSPPPSPPPEPQAASAADSAETAASREDNAAAKETETVDVNTATYEELVEILGVGVVGAKRIIQEREKIGGFRSADEIGELLGLKPHQVEKIRKTARFSPISKKQNHSRVIDY